MKNFIDRLQSQGVSAGFWHRAFNGAVVVTLDGEFEFVDGMLRAGNGGMHNLVPNRVASIRWPVVEPEELGSGSEGSKDLGSGSSSEGSRDLGSGSSSEGPEGSKDSKDSEADLFKSH